jgi:hypothetical protein
MSTATRVAAGVTAAYLRELTRDTAGAGQEPARARRDFSSRMQSPRSTWTARPLHALLTIARRPVW